MGARIACFAGSFAAMVSFTASPLFGATITFNPGPAGTMVDDRVGPAGLGTPAAQLRDLNPAAGVIDFDNTAAGASGFAGPLGYNVSGRVDLAGGGAIIGAGARIISLTNFMMQRPVGAAGGNLPIVFQHTFPAPPPAGATTRADAIFGTLDKVAAPAIAAGEITGTFQGFVNGAGVGAVYGFASLAGVVTNIANGNVVMAPGAPPWTLMGQLELNLRMAGDRVRLPASAEVAVSGESLTAIPEPGTLTISSLGALALLMLSSRRRKA